jgi:hypothetical protein
MLGIERPSPGDSQRDNGRAATLDEAKAARFRDIG